MTGPAIPPDAGGPDAGGPGPAGSGPDAPGPESVPAVDPPTPLEWAGWGLLAALTIVILLLAFLRPTDPGSIVHEIRLAAGFDRYEAAMQEGDRMYATAVAELRLVDDDDEQGREALLQMLARAADRFRTARQEAEGFHEDQRAQIEIARVHYTWARELLERADRPWYRRDDVESLERALEIVDQALALPDLPGDVRNDIEEMRTRIERAITPWPIL